MTAPDLTAPDLTAPDTLAAAIARFVAGLTLDNLPPDVVEKARVCLLNGYGIALGGHDTPYAPVARAAALALHGERSDGATMLGNGRRTSVPGAALAGSALFHGRAQEDTCGAAHIGAVLIPLLTALVEAGDGPVERLLPALVAGYEAGGLLENAFSPLTTPAGLRASPLYGTLAAAAGAAHLLGLPEERIAAALANAASFTGGILQSFDDGTDEWRYQVGVAAVNGLTAARLAAAGSVSAPAPSRDGPASSAPSPAPAATLLSWRRGWAATGRSTASPSSPTRSAPSTRPRSPRRSPCAKRWRTGAFGR
nr:MmgE/PrpD family protein [Azospirillum argentinense]